MRAAVETYFSAMRSGHETGAGTNELSYYPQLSNLLGSLGNELKPKLTVVQHPRNTGAGIPDAAFYTAEQRQLVEAGKQFGQVPPSRGVVEIKPLADDVVRIANSSQVRDYVDHYGQVLVTNYRDFLLVDRNHLGEIRLSERLTLATSEREFWDECLTPQRYANRIGDQLSEYLHRVMIRQVSLTKPQDVALLLASYARDMKARLEHQPLDDLAPMREALETALGISFQGEEGASFFRSTLVQTLFYGMFSAWVLQKRGIGRTQSVDEFSWTNAGHTLRVPLIRDLFYEFTRPGSVDDLGIRDVLDWTEEMLNRIDAGQFFSRFSEDHAVQFFYEPFLEAFDPRLRKQLGVWYTPPEIVTYMVERVDRSLREDLGVERGLADPSVYVLDPCTGTGSYLIAVMKRIYQTLQEEGDGALSGEDLRTAVRERLFGFELLPAPFVVAHLQVGLALQDMHAELSGSSADRPGIYLTNALTGWGEAGSTEYRQVRERSLLASLDRERNEAGSIKQQKPILVVIGNPPYNGYAGIAVDEERELSDAYREAKRTKQPQGQGLNDLYIRFFRMAERRIVEQTKSGIVCYISNYSWLDGLSFTAMRERFLDVFDEIEIDNLNGDKYKTGKLTPEGKPDPSVFSTSHNREGIQVGTAISLLVRKSDHRPAANVSFRNWWGTSKREDLVQSLQQGLTHEAEQVVPVAELGFPYPPATVSDAYLTWPQLPDLFPVYFPGVKTSRDDVVVDIDRDRLIGRMQTYFDPNRSDAEIERLIPGAMMSNNRTFEPKRVRSQLLHKGFSASQVFSYAYRPFDVRWIYWESETNLLDRKVEDFMPHLGFQNIMLVSQQKARRTWSSPQAVSSLGCLDLMDRSASHFPRSLSIGNRSLGATERRVNLSDTAQTLISVLDIDQSALLIHALAIQHSGEYLKSNIGALLQDWARIPLPESEDVLAASAELGHRLAALLDIEKPVPGISSQPIRADLRAIGVLEKLGGGNVDPGRDDLRIDVGWGRGGNGKPVMPGRGRSETRSYTAAELESLTTNAVPDLLGERTLDISLNDRVFWRNVPERVWTYSLGGYQVLKKWLSYRESSILGRDLKTEEVRTFTEIARRIAAILLLEPELDANYVRVIERTWDWNAAVAAAEQEKVKGIGPQQGSLM